MPTFVTFYAYAFEGAPSAYDEAPRGWFEAPAIDHLMTTRSRTALGRASDDTIQIYRCHGALDDREVLCDGAQLLYEGSAGDSLWWFTMYCARSVQSAWKAPVLVREYLMTGSPSLREVAHKCAWAASSELTGTARLAARVAMYAASDERPLLAAREACRLAGQIAGGRLPAVAALQERALASALLGLTAAYRARLATEAPLESQITDDEATIDDVPDRLSPTYLYAG
jgi:hypothetical protein